ncbi:SusC/RagA family TonB-linked outer membrane protein [Portibacter marinus]|uniref:SusC/RagA family TonB-linked outer membrane protein n=1 Tax=Portibacter marinus TaxID=2898660 RepID=UPI001F453998|nr:SusC/RagA family TonB-linked outer membrane protein [Portibacter marinus]
MEKLNSHKLKGFLALALSVLLSISLTGQRTITGVVTDAESGETLIGANVVVTGTTTGTITDFDGAYALEVPEDATSLTFSYTGFNEKVMPITGEVINVELSAGQLLEEVVVVGYGSVKKGDATGAVVALGEDDFNSGIVNSPEELIQGRAAGVQITTSSGEPGAGASIRIRGAGSIRNGNNPLFVVDGVPLGGGNVSPGGNTAGLGSSSAKNPLNFLNPNDIASINILKDASATAIYGSRGANGVVIITTKKGNSNKALVEYNGSVSTSTITRKYDLLGREEFLNAYASFNGEDAARSVDGGADTDWQDEILRTGISHNHNLSISGGLSSGSYRFSLGYLDQQGIVDKSGFDRLTGRFNVQNSFLNDRLTIASQVTVSQLLDQRVPITDNAGFRGDLWGSALKLNPTQPVFNADGTLNQPSLTEYNPVALIEFSDDNSRTLRGFGNISGTFNITDNLAFKTVGGFDRTFSNRQAAFSRALRADAIVDRGRAYIDHLSNYDLLWENYLTYDQDLGVVNLSALAGYSYQSFLSSGQSIQAYDYPFDDTQLMVNNITASEKYVINNGTQFDELQSVFGRVNLGFADKYILTATIRRDGSSRFGPNNKYGTFPSLAFKWRLIDEDFTPDFFSDLGLRIGYGRTGNQEIPYNQWQRRIRYGGDGINNGGDINNGGVGDVSFNQFDLRWENTTQYNVGLDFGFMNNRLSGSLDWYTKNTNDLLIQVPSAQPAPQPFVWSNLDADIINTGLELALNYIAVDNNNMTWDINFNIATNNNTITNYNNINDTGAISGQGLTGAFAQRIAEGQPLYAYFVREFDGFDEEGISVYPNGDKQEFTGAQPIPTVSLGLTNSFNFGDLDVSFFFNGQFGHWIYNNTANALFTAGALANGRNVTSDVPGNGESNLNAPDVSTRFLERGDFVRLQNLNVGYRVPIQSNSVSGLRLFLTGQNLLLFTNYTGQDPEVDTNKSINGIPSVGIDYTAFPRARTFTLGANVTF